jgi:hypothetical protein
MLEPDEEPAAAPPIQKFRSTAVGTIFAAGLLGLRDVFEPPRDEEPGVVQDWSGGPEPFSEPYVLRLDPDNPADSIVLVRPHLKAEDQRRRYPAPPEAGPSGLARSAESDNITRSTD